MSRFASGTAVSPEKSRMEIEQTLKKYGASAFAYGEELGKVMLMFKVASSSKDITLSIRMIVMLPNRNEKRYGSYATGRVRKEIQLQNAYEQDVRQRWRALLLIVKAKLEACACGISTVEREFMSDIMVPGTGQTIGEVTFPALEDAYRSGKPLPPLLPGV